MDRDTLDRLWQQALMQSVSDGEQFTRYRFAALVAAHEREECAKVCDAIDRRWINQADKCAAAIRSRT